jgi:hypothetical protein
MDMDLAQAARKTLEQIELSGARLPITDPVGWIEQTRDLLILTRELAQHIEDARVELRNIERIYDEYDRLNNGE